MKKDNVSITFSEGLCMGCGVCEDICPKQCIHIERGKLNIPHVDENTCMDCGLCRKVCAGQGIDIEVRAKNLFGETPQYNIMLGHYVKTYKGFSTEYENRFHCASGGCLSQFLIWLLEKGEIDGAILTGYDTEDPMHPRVYIARNREEVLAGKSSKYCVVTMNGIAKEIHNTPGKYVIVGLPCHIHAFRKYGDVDKMVRERIVGFFSIFCSGNKNMDSQRYLLWRYGINKNIVESFTYRDNGCLGSMYFRDREGETINRPIPYFEYYGGLRSFFSISRCYVCTDFFGELADIGFGDLNDGSEDDDPIGINSLITRSSRWDSLLMQCANEGHLELSEIDEEKMIYANRFCSIKKGSGQHAARTIRKISGLKSPSFDNLNNANASYKSYITYIAAVVMRLIGSYRVLWPIIRIIEKSKN